MDDREFSAAMRRRRFYLLMFCAVNFVTGALYTWSLFAQGLAERFTALTGAAVSSADLAGVFGLATGLTPFMMLFGGIVNDRFGPRFVIALGGLMIGAGYLLMPLCPEPALLYGAYGVLVGCGTGLVNGCTISTAVKFFPDRRGFAGGTVTAALGIGAVVWPAVAGALIGSAGIAAALCFFGAVSLAVIVPLGLLSAKCPDGFAARVTGGKPGAAASEGTDWKGMVRTPGFWLLLLLFICASTLGLMLFSNLSGMAGEQIGLSAAAAAAAVSAVSLANACGRFFCSLLSDRIGRVPALMAALVAAALGEAALLSAGRGDAALFFTGIALIGLCFGAAVGIYPGLVADEYGAKHNSVNFSVMMLGYSAGSLAGPSLIAWARTGEGFLRAYEVSIAAALLGLCCGAAFLWLKRSKRAAA